jgi:hypothetical protein
MLDKADEQLKNSVRLGRRYYFAEIEVAQKYIAEIAAK